MSSMWRAVAYLPVVLAAAPSSSAQYGAPALAQSAAAYALPSVSSSIGDWRRLRRSANYSFADYAAFLIANPGWPNETTMRRWAEKAMRPGENPATVLAFFATKPPTSGNGYARLADSYAAGGRMTEALAAAKEAWASADLGDSDEQAIWARYGGSFTRTDHDRRADALLFAKDAKDAKRFLEMVSPERRPAFAARIAMQTDAPDTDTLYRAAIGSVTTDAGLMMGRLRYLRAKGYGDAAQQLAAR
ncbi:MAG TPA: lytic transglycosylase domain-containing protein, partial [Sphingomicrobium sp.]|nr:lytic transglycosylase domain-containing protein [Sphingomicrobium sp.]